MPSLVRRLLPEEGGNDAPTKANMSRNERILESWAQGFNVGPLVFLMLVVMCNYRKGVFLHKLILLELFLAVWHGWFIFLEDPIHGWALSTTAALLYVSYNVHNLVSWLKIRPFLPKWGGYVFIVTLGLVQPYWILNTWANFQYFNQLGSELFETTRLLEPLMRDPWWIFTTVKLVFVIQKNYDYTLISLIRTSPKFGVMLFCMLLSIIFLITDVIITVTVSKQSGINPFWRLALVFKCASDTIFLDDFKSVLDGIVAAKMKRFNNSGHHQSYNRHGAYELRSVKGASVAPNASTNYIRSKSLSEPPKGVLMRP